MSIEVWTKNLKKHYPTVNVEKVARGNKGKGFVVYVDGEKVTLNHFLRRFYQCRVDRNQRNIVLINTFSAIILIHSVSKTIFEGKHFFMLVNYA